MTWSIPRGSSRGLSILALVAAAGLSACGADPRTGLSAIPEPDGLDAMSPEVLRQYEERREALDRALADRAVPAKDLARASGELGQWFHAHRVFDAAQVAYGNASLVQPDDFRWPYLLGQILAKRNDAEAAAEQYRRALDLRPDYVPGWVSMAEMDLDAGRLTLAREAFQRAIQLDPECARAVFGLGSIAMDLEETAEAVARFETALSLQPSASDVLYSLGMAHRKLGHQDHADVFLSRANIRENSQRVTLDLDDPVMDAVRRLRQERSSYRVRKAEQLFNSGRYEQSANELRSAIQDSGDSGSIRFLLGLVLRRLNQHTAAEEDFRRSLELRPGYAPAYFQLGVLAERQSDFAQAESLLRRAIEIDSGFRAAHQKLGELLRSQGRCREAIDHFEQQLELDPATVAPRFSLAACLLEVERGSEAHQTVSRGLKLNPNAHRLRHLEARMLSTLPDPELRDGKRALAMAAPNGKQQINFRQVETLAMALAELGRFPEAVRWQERVLEMVESGRQESSDWVRLRLASYRAGRAIRQVWLEGEPQILSPLLPAAGDRAQSLPGATETWLPPTLDDPTGNHGGGTR